ncbi:histidinol-phosphatase HisJ [Parageobacillus sp. VR-IP]|uniref:histidinol-phosphatase HisJ n=1 Tax=Parageobacillus sp. VR-IP TaxID=2742205 RepID=UPI0015839D90|nr:histidinol-phosphatase HisJ [Parageobacillus sp. VR-IP]NUK30602.1 histidinol-phosphatase HisJ [Parageobacillus sp. VR-IP]
MRDGHIHTPFCPHGSSDPLERYVERAIALGYKEISFTEHAPLPEGFTDPTPYQDSAMRREQLDQYFTALDDIKARYRNDIIIHTGLEVDFIPGFEEKTARFLEEVGSFLDDSILSVHFLYCKGQYVCIDYSPEMFGDIIRLFSTIDNVYKTYYHTVLQSIRANLGRYKPKRIGHLTLVRKFQRQFPCPISTDGLVLQILDEIKERGYEIDYNGAGVTKPLCLQPYPPNEFIREAMKRNIRIIYGSDAHRADDLHQGTDEMIKEAFSFDKFSSSP